MISDRYRQGHKLTLKKKIMNAQQQIEALQNALNSFGLTNLTLHPKISEDKREKTPKFFLNFGFQTISPVLSYENMNSFIMGMGAYKKIN